MMIVVALQEDEEEDMYTSHVHMTCIQKDHRDIHTLKILSSLSVFSGSWKYQNNPVCTKSV